MKLLRLLWPAFLILAASACQTKVSRSPVEGPDGSPTISLATRAWEVVERGMVAGVVIEFSEREGERRFFSVRNPDQQELGMVDSYGRAWRFLPHAEESDWLGTGTVARGAGQILGLEGEAELYEIELGLLQGEATPPRASGE